MGFNSVAENLVSEKAVRPDKNSVLSFGVNFLDVATRGIFPDDLVLVGAPSGKGKTQFCIQMALANVNRGKRVHFFALEAGEYELERRIKFQLIADQFFRDENRPAIYLNIPDWLLGNYNGQIDKYEQNAMETFEQYVRLNVFYKDGDFGISQMIENIFLIEEETDMILIDHVHYFDFDDPDNKAIKEIAKAARTMSLTIKKPIVLVSHLRKRDRFSKELCSGLDEFHGSSDLFKIASKAVTMAPGPVANDGTVATYFRIPKNRMEGSVTRYLGQVYFDPQKGSYEQAFEVSWAEAEIFQPLTPEQTPYWAKGHVTGRVRGSDSSIPQRQPGLTKNKTRNFFNPSSDKDD